MFAWTNVGRCSCSSSAASPAPFLALAQPLKKKRNMTKVCCTTCRHCSLEMSLKLEHFLNLK